MEYVRERLLIAGHDNGEIFTTSALRTVYRYAAGIPRVVNVLCDNALLAAYVCKSLRVSARMIDEAAKDLGLVREDLLPEQPEATTAARDGWIRRISIEVVGTRGTRFRNADLTNADLRDAGAEEPLVEEGVELKQDVADDADQANTDEAKLRHIPNIMHSNPVETVPAT